MAAGARSEIISNIQAMRAWAAIVVVFYHTAFVIPGTVHTDYLGVTIFFVISGFIMTHITRESAEGFLTARLIRIVPLYWIATLFVVLWTGMAFNNVLAWAHYISEAPAAVPGLLIAQFRAIPQFHHPIVLLRSALFIPTMSGPVLGIGWTLNIEMFFYVVFWASLQASRRWAPLITIAILVICKLPVIADSGSAGVAFAHPYTVAFIGGIGVYYAWRLAMGRLEALSAPLRVCLVLAFAGLAAILYLMAAFYLLRDVPRSDVICSVAMVLAALLLHSSGFRIKARWILLLGNASYAIYLFHPAILETVRPLAGAYPWLTMSTHWQGASVAVVASCIFAIGAHLWVEKPVLKGLRVLLTRARRPPEVTPIPVPATS